MDAGQTKSLKNYKMIINGDLVEADSGQQLEIESPGTKTIFARVPRAAKKDVDMAVSAASTALPHWSKVSPRDRGRILLKIADDLEAEIEPLANIIAKETGNAIRTQARPEATQVSDIFRYFGGLASELKGETIPISDNVLSYTRREPIGVVGAIIPWNAPVMLGALKIAPALCAGNTLVLKAAEDAPLGILKVAEICQKYLPAGVLNLLIGTGPECGEPLSSHQDIRKLSFTGSTEVGKLIMRAAAERIVPVSLELGGKSPSIVYPDANEDWVVDGVMSSMRFTRQSQSCTAGSRLFLHDKIFDSFIEKMKIKLSKLKIGDPLNEQSDVGAIINKKQFAKVCNYLDEGINQKGVELIIGGLPPNAGPLSKGYFSIPTIFSSDSNSWRLAREEIFGPVLVAIRWNNEADAIKMANDSHYGLAAYIWTQNMSQGINAAHSVEAGWVQVNQGLGQVPGQSYGGYKQSGIGREFSLEGMLDSFTQKKNVTINLSAPAPSLN